MHTKKIKLILTLLLIPLLSLAQDFDWKADLAPVKEKGVYKIDITPQITSRSNNRLTDIRLFANDTLEVPFAFFRETAQRYENQTIEMPEVSRSAQTIWKKNNLVIENQAVDTINMFIFRIPGSVYSIRVKVKGAYQKDQWQNIYNLRIQNDSFSNDSLDLPYTLPAESAFKYYSFEYRTSSDENFNIGKVFYNKTIVTEGKYNKIDSVSFKQTEDYKNKQTIIKINLPYFNLIEKIKVTLENEPDFYHREAMVAIPKFKRNNEQVIYENENYFTLDKKGSNAIKISGFHTNELHIVITNNDDAPLKIKNIELLQLKTTMVAMLDSAKKYTLKMGNDKIDSPAIYDIQNQGDSLLQIAKNIQIKPVETIPDDPKELNAIQAAQESNLLVWLAIGVVIVLLSFLSFKMIKDMKNKEKE